MPVSAIERVEVYAVGPDVELQGWASDLPPQYATLTIVRVFDASGVEGVGATPSYSTGASISSMLESLRHLAPRLIGRDPQLREADLVRPRRPHAARSCRVPESALDIALWDIAAQRAGVPLTSCSAARGPASRRMRRRRSWPTPRAYVEFVAELLEHGFRAVKFHAWCEPDRDLEMLRKVHAAHGDTGHGDDARRRAAVRPPLGAARRTRARRDGVRVARGAAPRPRPRGLRRAAPSRRRADPPGRQRHRRHPAGRRGACAATPGMRCGSTSRRGRLHAVAQAGRAWPRAPACGPSCRAGATR